MKKSLKLFKADDCEVHGFWRCAFQGARNDHSFDHDSGHDATRLCHVIVTLEILDSLVTAVTFFKGQVSSANGKTLICLRSRQWHRHRYTDYIMNIHPLEPLNFLIVFFGEFTACQDGCVEHFLWTLWGIFSSASCPKASWLKFEETSARANGIGSQSNYRIKGIAVDWV